MALKNNLKRQDQRRQNDRHFSDAPLHVDIRRSILDLRPLYPEMKDVQFSKWYQKRYGVNAGTVLEVLTT